MSKKRANGEGSIRRKPNGRWEGRYTVGVDTATGKATQVNTTYAGESETANPAVSGSITYSRLNGLYIVPAQKPLGATDQAVSITLSRSEMKLLPGCTTELTAEIMPWRLERCTRPVARTF